MLARIHRFIDILAESMRERKPVDLSRGFRCLTADLIISYAYGQEFGGLNSKNFKHPVIEAADDLMTSTQWATYFRRTFAVIDIMVGMLPDRVLKHLAPQLLAVRRFESVRETSLSWARKGASNAHDIRPVQIPFEH